ncbi:hypothetical protein IW146_001749 [Coemansia sp. RSA 922]|nr:hypothetical protein GGI14_003420 [Coemansia sp. S680]KAJ2116145.1 hypothetical protein IW146_001749 [Coemansia sp. RSA 922]
MANASAKADPVAANVMDDRSVVDQRSGRRSAASCECVWLKTDNEASAVKAAKKKANRPIGCLPMYLVALMSQRWSKESMMLSGNGQRGSSLLLLKSTNVAAPVIISASDNRSQLRKLRSAV